MLFVINSLCIFSKYTVFAWVLPIRLQVHKRPWLCSERGSEAYSADKTGPAKRGTGPPAQLRT